MHGNPKNNGFPSQKMNMEERVYRFCPLQGQRQKRTESAEARLCPATELAGAQVALQRSPIFRTSAVIVLPGVEEQNRLLRFQKTNAFLIPQ
jgi:NADH pyrophosphatase NudC (nudix superfamily)